MSDLIDRQAAIDALGDMPEGDDDFDTGCRQQWNWDTEAIKALPPAQPEPKREKWVLICDNNGMHFICDKCGAWRYHQKQKFCSECGADMREVTT